ncbi:MAG: hypothetical protein JXR61_06260 [Prolixibacteraceae bacterium]|nr:hypothetical protein [Prolixibacteraceae bacterium]
MKLLLIILLASIFCISIEANAQNCKKLDEWTQSVEKEFPDLDFQHLKIGSELHNRIKYNLLSDAYFVPVFNTPFDKISDNKKNRILYTINQCTPKLNLPGSVNINIYKPHESAKRLKSYMGNALRPNNRDNSEAVRNIQELRAIRNGYSQTIKMLESVNLTYPELNGYKNLLSSKYRMLLPSELERLDKLIKTREPEIAGKTLLAKANSVSHLENSEGTLTLIERFQTDYQTLFEQAESNTKQQVSAIIDKKTNEVLENLVSIEKDKINNIEISEGGIDKIDQLYIEEHERYKNFLKQGSVQDLFDDIKLKKTQIVKAISGSLQNTINSANSEKRLSDINSKYLSNVIYDDTDIQNLRKQISTKKQEIRDQKYNERVIAYENAQATRRANYSKIESTYETGPYAKSDFWFPGAIDLLGFGDILNFPDAIQSRRWLFHFYSMLVSGEPEGLPDEVYSINFQLKLMGYAGEMIYNTENINERTSAGNIDDMLLSDEGKFGNLDAKMLIANNRREDLTPIIKAAVTVITNYSSKPINPHAKFRFYSYGSQKLLNKLGISEKDIERFRPGYKDSWDLLLDQMEAKVKTELNSSDRTLLYSELHGNWLDTLNLDTGETIPLKVYFQFHNTHNEMSGIYFKSETYFMPAIIYRGDSRLETSMEMKNINFKKLFVGQLDDSGEKLTGIIHHYKLGDREYQVAFQKE